MELWMLIAIAVFVLIVVALPATGAAIVDLVVEGAVEGVVDAVFD